MELWAIFSLVGASFVAVMAIMVGVWVHYLINKRVSVVDIGWGLSFFAIGLFLFVMNSESWLLRLPLAVMVLVWSGRLTLHLLARFGTRRDDARYALLLERWGQGLLDLKILMFFTFQGIVLLFLSLPFYLVVASGATELTPLHPFSILLFGFALWGETLADRQLASFKKTHSGEEVCDRGLWRYSRHPNYFFEWCIWISFALYAWPSPGGWLALLSPVTMFVLLTRISGIPPAEEAALKHYGESYRSYQRRTSAFFPWFPRGEK